MRVLLLALAAAALAAGCEDDPFGYIDWVAEPDTVVLFSLQRPELQRWPSAFNFVGGGSRIAVERPAATGAWDIALTEEAGEFVLAPAGAVTGVQSGAGIAVVEDVAFEDLTEAPRDTADYRRREAVSVRMDAVYVVRTRPVNVIYGVCVYFAKLEPLEVDPELGALRFHYVLNPNCNDRALVPSGED